MSALLNHIYSLMTKLRSQIVLFGIRTVIWFETRRIKSSPSILTKWQVILEEAEPCCLASHMKRNIFDRLVWQGCYITSMRKDVWNAKDSFIRRKFKKLVWLFCSHNFDLNYWRLNISSPSKRKLKNWIWLRGWNWLAKCIPALQHLRHFER